MLLEMEMNHSFEVLLRSVSGSTPSWMMERMVPTKKGIFLTEENYKAMMECEGVVKQLIEKVKKGETV